MLKLLTKFKTQSLNEVRPYENNGSFMSFCGELQDDIAGVPNQSWPQEACASELEEVTAGGKKIGFAPACLSVSRFSPNELVKTVNSPAEPSPNRPMQLKHENKENGEQMASVRQEGGISSAEKRKWSDMRRHRSSKQLGCGGDSSSSDEEVKELFSKQQRSEESSPRKVHESRQYKSVQSGKVRPCESHARKRHRLTFAEDRIYRPSLDFEKMQQKVFWRKSSSSRPRVVKVRSFSGHPHNLLQDASFVSFQPIQAIQSYKLTPVEEPQALAY